MSVRSRAALTEAPVQVAKVFGPGVPESFRQGEEAAQMTPASAFGPGQPIGPYDGYDRTPRSREFVPGYNIATRPRTHERVAFDTLKGLFTSYDVARICVRHRIASLRSLDYKLTAAEGWTGDVSAEIAEGKRVLKRPDRKTLFKPWLAKYLRDVLSYDAGTLYKMRNRAGRAVGLKVVDGTMIAPLLDYWGDRPEPPAEAYVQYVNGLPWNWLTENDLIYEPYDPQPDSIYGTAPLEDILLNANTDIRFQLYFLQRFTEGNLPAAFASAPDSWSPDQIEQFQELWDAFMLGDQSRKHQIRWLPPGSKLAWSNEKDFSDTFSQFLMRKTCSAYSVVPADLGFTETVNKSSGESQADVQHRVGDLPMAHHIQDILSSFLQDDLQLPLDFKFDLGEEQDDRLDQAQSDKIYMELGVVGVSEIREMRYGLSDPEPVQRFIYTNRSGPIPLSAVFAVSGPTDPQSAEPEPGAPLPHKAFAAVEGVLPNPPVKVPGLAVQEFGPDADPASAAAAEAAGTFTAPAALPAAPVAKEGEGVPAGNVTAGITADTGIYSYDLDDGQYRSADEEERDLAAERARDQQVAKEMAAFRNFRRKRRAEGEWRDFGFRSVPAVRAHNLNDDGRLSVRKDAGEVAVAGLAVLAADTGRVLMIQRAFDEADPAAGKIEFPGGHMEGDESPLRAAWREFSEETGTAPPPGVQTGEWTAGDGIYRGIVWTAESEADVPVRGGAVIPNPDDVDGDLTEAILWVDPADLPGNPMVRDELAAALADVMPLLGVVTDEPDDIAKAGEPRPKVRKAAKAAAWPGWALDTVTAGYWSSQASTAAQAALTPAVLNQMAADYVAANPGQQGDEPAKRDRNKAAAAWVLAWLASRGIQPVPADVASGLAADAFAIGTASAAAAANGGGDAGMGGWTPGDTDSAAGVAEWLGQGDALGQVMSGSGDGTADGAQQDFNGGLAGALAVILSGFNCGLGGDLGGLLGGVLPGGSWLAGCMLTAVSFFCGLGALGWYQQNNVPLVEWLAEGDNPCPVCLENADAKPRPPGTAFPSGATAPPEHPRCMCALGVPAGTTAPPGTTGNPGTAPPPDVIADLEETEEDAAEEAESEEDAEGAGEEPDDGTEDEAGPAGPVAESSALADAYNAGHEETGRMTGGASGTPVKRVTLSDGTEAVVKTAGEASEALNGYLAGLVASALGIDGTAAALIGDDTLVARLLPGETGAALREAAGESGWLGATGPELERILQLGDGKEIGVLDFLTANADRNDGNYLVDGGVVRPIDHAYANFEELLSEDGAAEVMSPFARYWAAPGEDLAGDFTVPAGALVNPLSEGETAALRSSLESLQGEFAAKGASGQYEFMMSRLALLEGA